jgi:cytochrome c oxidase cbb3-type subunit II
MESLPKFVLGLAVCFGLPAFAMVLKPYANELKRQPIPYTASETHPDLGIEVDTEFYERPDLRGVVYPAATAGSKLRGQAVYGRMGCAQCHTQIIRPSYLGVDQYKRGWGADQESKGLVETRESTAWDYLGEDFAMIGQRRIGPDLANAGYRFKSAADVHTFLYSPRARHAWSNHPTYPSLYDVVAVEQTPRADSIKADGIPDGKQVVPTAEGKALAEYMLSLKRDLPLPISLSGKSVIEKKAAAK